MRQVLISLLLIMVMVGCTAKNEPAGSPADPAPTERPEAAGPSASPPAERPEGPPEARAGGQAVLWRQEPGAQPVKVATLEDRFERLYSAPDGQTLVLTEVAEIGYMDFYKVGLLSPATGSLVYADVAGHEIQAVQDPRWWSGGALISGISWGVHKVDWSGADRGDIPTMPEARAVRGTGVSPSGQAAMLISGSPDREKQVAADLLLGDRQYPGVTLLPLWPSNRSDTHYWPHFELIWLSEQELLIPDLASHFIDGGRQWRIVDLRTGESRPFPLAAGASRLYPAGDGKRILVLQAGGYAVVAEGADPVKVAVAIPHDRAWAPPVWSGDGSAIYWGPHTIDPATGRASTVQLPDQVTRVARDAAGRLYWLEPMGR